MAFSRIRLLSFALLVEGTVLLLAVLLAMWLDITLLPLSNDLGMDVAVGSLAAVLPATLFVMSLSPQAIRISWIGSLQKTLLTLQVVFSQARILDLVAISLVAGIAEEILFRGLIQTQLGILPASILFGLAHLITPAYAVIATIMGFYIGFIFQVFDSLLIPIQLHFIYDLFALLYLRYHTRLRHRGRVI